MSSPRLSEFTSGRSNNFDLLRLGAATVVLVSHSWGLSHRTWGRLGGLGQIGVAIFLAISGFLVARSWDRDPRPLAFAVKRVLRLWPALIAFVLLTGLVLGPFVTTLPLHSYFDAQTGRYLLLNTLLHTHVNLPGVFPANPDPGLIAGPLWTLPVEVRAYVVLLLLGLVGLARRPLIPLLLLVVLDWVIRNPVDYSSAVMHHLLVDPVRVFLLMVFLGGALLYTLRDWVRLDWRIAIVAATLLWFLHRVPAPFAPLVWPLTVPYLLAMGAYRTPAFLRKLTRHGDVSYGIYLWGFPVQQTIIAIAGGSIQPGWLLVSSAIVTYAIAYASWRLIESPALRLKATFAFARRRAAPASVAAAVRG